MYKDKKYYININYVCRYNVRPIIYIYIWLSIIKRKILHTRVCLVRLRHIVSYRLWFGINFSRVNVVSLFGFFRMVIDQWEIIFFGFDVKFSRLNVVSLFITIGLFRQQRKKKKLHQCGTALYQSLHSWLSNMLNFISKLFVGSWCIAMFHRVFPNYFGGSYICFTGWCLQSLHPWPKILVLLSVGYTMN